MTREMSMLAEREQLRGILMEFLEKHWRASGKDGPLPAFGGGDNLLGLGLVDSLSLAEMLVVLEEHTGQEIDFLTVDPEVFFTLDGILDLLT